MPQIHPTAVIEDGARLGDGVTIGPFCHIGAQVELGDGADVKSHVVIAGHTKIGLRAKIFPFASIGHQPQDLKYRGETSSLIVGDDCIIREGVTMNPGTDGGGGQTIIGNSCAFLANSHVGHDCRIGDNVILVNNVMLAGHVTIGDFAVLGGGSAVIQFARVGPHAMVGGLTGVESDLIPYGLAKGNRAFLAGLNLVGLKRRNFSREAIQDLRRAYGMIFASEGTLAERVEATAAEFPDQPQVHEILDFIRAGGNKAICAPLNADEQG